MSKRPPIHDFEHEDSTWSVRLEIELPSLNKILRSHWAEHSRLKKGQKDQVCWCFRLSRKKPPAPPCVVRLHRIGKGALDGDNLQGAFKAVRDQVAIELGIDDADPRVHWEYGQSICKKNDLPSITITITAQ